MTAVGNDQLAQDLQRHRLLLGLFKGVTSSLREARKPDAAVRSVLRELCNRMEWPIGAFYAVDGHREIQVPAAHVHFEPDMPAESLHHLTSRVADPSTDSRQRAAAGGAPASTVDVTRDPHFHATRAAVSLGIRGEMALPVVEGPDLFGVLQFFSAEPMQPGDDLVEILNEVSHQLGRSLRQHHLIAALESATNGRRRAAA